LSCASASWASTATWGTSRAISEWMANNFVARLLSPQTFGEKAMLLGCIIAVIWALTSVYIHNQRIKMFKQRYMKPAATAAHGDSRAMVAELAEKLMDSRA